MDTSNRQEKDGIVVSVSERVAVVANLKKIGCNELTPLEWVELIDVALAMGKPHFKYLPFFLPVKQMTLKHFCFSMNYSGDGKEYEDSFWLEDTIIVESNSPPDGTLAAFVEDAKVVQICEVSDKEERSRSMKVLLNSHGVFILAHCRYPKLEEGKNRFVSGKATIYRVEILPDTSFLKWLLNTYPQIGPDTLFAISAMVNETYQKRQEVLRNLDCVGKRLKAICNNVDAGFGHYIKKWPWGVSDGSDKIVEQIGH